MAAFHLVTSTATEIDLVGHVYGILATIQWPNTADGSTLQAAVASGDTEAVKEVAQFWRRGEDGSATKTEEKETSFRIRGDDGIVFVPRSIEGSIERSWMFGS